MQSRHLQFRNVIDHYVKGQSTVNVCLLDLTKAFDKMNHSALLSKLLQRRCPVQLISIFEQWFQTATTCVKWGGSFSHFFHLQTGVRQGGVLSPYFFAIFIDELIDKIKDSKIGCYLSAVCVSVFLYADDIAILAPSVESLQALITLCENHLDGLDMRINASKSCCIRFGPRFDVECVNLTTRDGNILQWVNSCRYLGIYFLSGRLFRCKFDNAKRQFFRSFNSVFSRTGRFASDEVILSLLHTKCLPVLLYGTEACYMNVRDRRSFDFVVNRIFMKIFRTGSIAVVEECQRFFNFLPVRHQIEIKIAKFLQKFTASDNLICRLFSQQAKAQLNVICATYQLQSGSTACKICARIRRNFLNHLYNCMDT